MVAQKCQQKTFLQKLFAFDWLLTQNSSNQALKYFDSFRPQKRLLQNQKTGGSREFFRPENDFQTSSTVNFSKNIQILKSWKPTIDMKFRLEFFSVSHILLHMSPM